MKTWNLVVVVGILSSLSALGGTHDAVKTGRGADKKKIYPEKYTSLVEHLSKNETKVSVTGVTKADDKWVVKPVTVGGEKAAALPELLDEVKTYREKMAAKECAKDSSNKFMGFVMDGYIESLYEALVTGESKISDPTKGPGTPGGNVGEASKELKLDEKMVITYTTQLRKFLNAKRDAAISKDKFDSADDALIGALNKMELLLWGGKITDSTTDAEVLKKIQAREKEFAEEKANADAAAGGLKAVVDQTGKALAALGKLKDDDVCVLNSADKEEPKKEEPGKTTPDLREGPTASTGAQPAGNGTGGIGGGGGPAAGGQPNPNAELQRQFADLQRQVADRDDLDRFDDFDDLDRQRDDDLINKLADRVGSRVGGNRENSETAPQLTLPGIQGGGQGGGQQAAAIPPMPVYQQPEPFPYQALMAGQNQQPQQPQIINAESLLPKRAVEPAKTGTDPMTAQLMAEVQKNNQIIADLQRQKAAQSQQVAVTNLNRARLGGRTAFRGANRMVSRARPNRVAGRAGAATQSSSSAKRPSRVR